MKNKKYTVLKKLFRQYQDGTLPEREKTIIDEWFNSHNPEDVVDLLQDPEAEERIYLELRQRISRGIQPARVRTIWSSVWVKAACAAGALFLIGTLYQLKRSSALKTAQQNAYQTITTTNAQVSKIMLPDSTEVWLNAATTIRVPLHDDDTSRVVYLDKGEAFFNVKHDPDRTFKVISGNLTTHDIGTEFNIRAYELKKEYRVAVSTGKVAVSKLDASGKLQVISDGLIGGQQLIYDVVTGKSQLTKKDAAMSSGWRTGESIYLDAMTLEQIGDELARKYNVKVTVSSPELDTSQYTFHLANQSLGQILEQLTIKTGITYSLDSNNLTLNPADKR